MEPWGAFVNKFMNLKKEFKKIWKLKNHGQMYDKSENGEKVWKSYFDKNFNFKLLILENERNISIWNDVINIRGHRMNWEIEFIVLKQIELLNLCNTSLEIKEINCVTLKNFKKLRYTIEKSLIESCSKDILFVNSIPKTRSENLRRIIKEILLNKKFEIWARLLIFLNYWSYKTNYPSFYDKKISKSKNKFLKIFKIDTNKILEL